MRALNWLVVRGTTRLPPIATVERHYTKNTHFILTGFTVAGLCLVQVKLWDGV